MRNELEIELDSFFSMTPPQVCMLCDCCFDNISVGLMVMIQADGRMKLCVGHVV